jgi:hypothetical protein
MVLNEEIGAVPLITVFTLVSATGLSMMTAWMARLKLPKEVCLADS